MRLLIVGCGYLGQTVAARAQANGDQVIALTRSSLRAREFTARGWQPVVGEICEPATLAGLPAVDAALLAVGYDRQSDYSQEKVYVDGIRNVLQTLSGRCPHAVYISSSSVYGQHAGEWVDETSVCEPVQPGGQYCLQSERYLLQEWSGQGQTANVLRLSGIYGPGRLLSRIESLQQQQALTGSAESWLNLIHVEDAAAAVQASLSGTFPGKTWVVSDHEPVRRGDYYRFLAAAVGAPPPVFDESQPSRRGAGGLNKRCRSDLVQHDLELTWQYPTFREGVPHALGSLRDTTAQG